MNREKLEQYFTFLGRHLFCTACTALAVACAVIAGFWWNGIQDLKSEHEEKSQAYDRTNALLIMGPIIRQELERVREYTRRIEDNLTDENEKADNVFYFDSLRRQTGVTLDTLSPLTSPQTDGGQLYKRLSFSLRATGTYTQVQNFLHAIETGPRLAVLTSVSMRRLAAGSTDISLELNLDLLGKL